MNQNHPEGNNNIVIKEIKENEIIVEIDGKDEVIENKFSELKRILESQKEHFVKYDKKIFDLESKLRESNTVTGSENVINNSTIGDIGGNLRIGNDTIINITIINPPNPLENLTKKQRQELDNKRDAINLLKSIYEERFSKKMNKENNLRIEIENSYTKIGTDSEQRKYVLNDYVEGTLRNEKELISDFLQKHKRLIIIGNKGSGKSLLLLKFASELINKPLENDNYLIPLVLNLSNYEHKKVINFQEWIVNNIKIQIQNSNNLKNTITRMIKEKQIILLLDGLDEVHNNELKNCISAINNYISSIEKSSNVYSPQIIICCRDKEYKKLPIKLSVKAITKITPLKIDKVIQYLFQKNIKASKILAEHLKANKIYIVKKRLFTTAFEINIALSIAEKHLIKNFNVNKLETDNLIDTYVEEEVKKIKKYKHNETKNYLSFLANKLNDKNTGEYFELVDIQLNWLNNVGLYKVIIYILTLTIWLSINYVLFDYIGGGFLIALAMFNKKRINIKIISFDLKQVNKHRAIMGIVSASVVSVIFFLLTFLLDSELALLFGTVSFFIVLFSFLFIKSEKVESYSPYSIFLKEIINLIFLFLPINLIFVVFVDLFVFSIFGEEIALSIMITTLLNTTFACIIGCFIVSSLMMHIVARFILKLEKKAPLSYVSFLNDENLNGILYYEDNTGKWRFRHQLIQDRLAGKEIKKK
ncbi:putative NTPase (NACHT family) [Bernardetia litoralis DSM 6794]|uniref:Putative NTPase (NACHT family) n=1 Tax=Bernardetia litoralis (strain ATCC 23117 / DSM 6794 / NBRC 15988 / NCIMB 1366 / Fx l1 / Sio-4) TaxID=880071 RepID=I4AHF6_BERLS|nr:NACHT domain-containing protein [Bernardetia litoralis]AFM03391.1 putative NTPase (NACHT family) [Bernardetia litoralis DSM 6794]